MAMSLRQRVEHAEKEGFTPSELARAAGVSTSAAAQWKTGVKSLKAASVMGLSRLTGWPVDWWAEGKGPPPKRGQTPPSSEPLAHSMSLQSATLLPTVTWEQLMARVTLPEVFTLEAQDDSMAPTIRSGTGVIWSTKKAPRIGAGILVRDAQGNVYTRRMHEGTAPGHYLAVPLNPAFKTLDSQSDGLSLLAVFDGVRVGLEELT